MGHIQVHSLYDIFIKNQLNQRLNSAIGYTVCKYKLCYKVEWVNRLNGLNMKSMMHTENDVPVMIQADNVRGLNITHYGI